MTSTKSKPLGIRIHEKAFDWLRKKSMLEKHSVTEVVNQLVDQAMYLDTGLLWDPVAKEYTVYYNHKTTDHQAALSEIIERHYQNAQVPNVSSSSDEFNRLQEKARKRVERIAKENRKIKGR